MAAIRGKDIQIEHTLGPRSLAPFDLEVSMAPRRLYGTNRYWPWYAFAVCTRAQQGQGQGQDQGLFRIAVFPAQSGLLHRATTREAVGQIPLVPGVPVSGRGRGRAQESGGPDVMLVALGLGRAGVVCWEGLGSRFDYGSRREWSVVWFLACGFWPVILGGPCNLGGGGRGR